MTDSTFKVLAPYTLPILYAIFANESIPIAFGVSPTETAASYEQIYSHIERIYDGVVRHAPTQSASSSVEFVEGTRHWPADPLTDREERLTGEPLPPPWKGSVVTIDNAITGQEPPMQDGRAFLQSIPIVTDQGTALASFIAGRNLDWKICHRHIIEAMGAGSLLGHWATRLLCCYSESDWDYTRSVIMNEMVLQAGHYSRDVPGYISLLKLLGLVENDDDHCLASRAH
jgi:hypothetical protein